MAVLASTRPPATRPQSRRAAKAIAILSLLAFGGMLLGAPARAQLAFPATPPPVKKSAVRLDDKSGQKQMLVQADEIKYDYANHLVAAVGSVQIYYGGATVEADKITYNQTTKRLRAEGNVRLSEPDGKVTYGQVMDLADNYRDGFVDLLRLDAPDRTRMAAARAERSKGNFTVFHNGVYTACAACKDNPKNAAAVAGQGRPHRSRPERKDDVFRERQSRILRPSDCLDALLLGARSDRQAQDRLLDAVGLDQLELRHRRRHPLLLGVGAGLRRHA